MRIVTRPDFDGIASAVLLRDLYPEAGEILWVEPYEIRERAGEIRTGDIIANLEYVSGCSRWYDHHATNRVDVSFEGAFAVAPSAAGVIYKHHANEFSRDYGELIAAADKLDSADLSVDEVLHPERYPWVKLSIAVGGKTAADHLYFTRLVDLLAAGRVENALEDGETKGRIESVLRRDQGYEAALRAHTRMEGFVAVTDFRGLDAEPKGNRFLVYCLFPESRVDMKIRYKKDRVVVSLGSSIFNEGTPVHLGDIAARYGGGGHRGAASCSFSIEGAEPGIAEILTILQAPEA